MDKNKRGKKEQKRQIQQQKKAEQISNKIEKMISLADYQSDPFGSYTGIPADFGEVPIQDADDL